MKKIISHASIVATIGLTAAFAFTPTSNVLAASKTDQLQQIQQKQSNVQSKLHKANNQIDQINVKQDQVDADLNKIDSAIGDTTTKITEKNKEIQENNAQIEKLNSEIDALIERINQRNEILKERARSFQETGGQVSYIDVLVGASSFSDFIDRVNAVAVIMEADKDIIEEQNADKAKLQEKQDQVEKTTKDLETMRKELQSLKSNLEVQKQEKNQIMKSLKKQETKVEELKLSLEEKNENLAAQKAAIKKLIELEKAAKNRVSKGNSHSSSPSSSSSSAPAVSSGSFTRPAAGSVSSGFGYRSFDGGGFHDGVDIANSVSVPVVAAADGVVSRSYSSSSYGETIMITHNVNGQRYTTVYAHLSSRLVGNLATVSKGQVIGYMGNTGHSFGQHLHFELHRGEWNPAKTNAIDPRSVVPI